MLFSFARNAERRSKKAHPLFLDFSLYAMASAGGLGATCAAIPLQMRRMGNSWRYAEKGQLPEWIGVELSNRSVVVPAKKNVGRNFCEAISDNTASIKRKFYHPKQRDEFVIPKSVSRVG